MTYCKTCQFIYSKLTLIYLGGLWHINPLGLFNVKSYIYIYTYMCVCVWVYLGSISSLIHTCSDNIDILCLHIFVFILSSRHIDFMVSILCLWYFNKLRGRPKYFWVLQKINVIYQFKCILRDCISENNNIHVGLTSTTLSRQLTMHLSDTSLIAQHLKKTFLHENWVLENSYRKHNNIRTTK